MNKELENILYCVDSLLSDHNDRNYGDRDKWIDHLSNHWEEFINKHPESEDPLSLVRKNCINIK